MNSDLYRIIVVAIERAFFYQVFISSHEGIILLLLEILGHETDVLSYLTRAYGG